MSAVPLAPRIDVNHLAGYRGQVVRLVGQVTETDQNKVTLVTPQGKAEIQKLPDSVFSDYMEVVGRVNQDNSIEEYSNTAFGPDFDIKLYGEAVALTQQYPDLF